MLVDEEPYRNVYHVWLVEETGVPGGNTFIVFEESIAMNSSC